MAVSGIAAAIAGITGATLLTLKVVDVPAGFGIILEPEKHLWFTVDAWAHAASYLMGFVAGLIIILHTIWRRIFRSPV